MNAIPFAGQSRRSALFTHLTTAVAGGLVWGAMMAVTALYALIVKDERAFDAQVFWISAIYFAGGGLGLVLTWPFAVWARGRIRFALALPFAACALTGFTLAATAAVLALDYRAYYAQWHGDALSKTWFYQQFYTALGSTYQFAVIGIRLYWPLGVLFLIPTSWWLARRAS